MSLKVDCPRCGAVRACDECGEVFGDWHVKGKVVIHGQNAASPAVWGEWCSRTCLLAALTRALDERRVVA